jgi:DNA damage-binding protein 1
LFLKYTPQSDCNLFTYRVSAMDDDISLEREGFYHLGELINKFLTGMAANYGFFSIIEDKAGTIATYSEDDPFQAKPLQLFFTSVGRIGVISEFGDELSFSMTELQRNLNGVIKGPGDITHAEYVHLFTLLILSLNG